MAGEQAASTPPETQSYDSTLMADVAGAYKETEAATPAATEKAETPVAEPDKTPAQVKADEAGRLRDETGKFAAKPTEDKPAEPEKAAEVKATDQPKPGEQPKPLDTKPTEAQQAPAVAGPPPGWSVKSKAEWDKIPEHIRADIAKREQEVNQGFAQYAGMKPLAPYVEMAKQRGTTLNAVLDNYMNIENMLSQNFLQGVLHIASRQGINPQQLAHAMQPYLGQANQQQAPQDGQGQQFDPNILQQYVNPLTQKINTLEQHLFRQQQAEQTRTMGAINSVLERFTSDPAHRFYANVEPSMLKLLEGGIVPRTGDYATDLKAAYELACRLDPEISDHLLNERIAKTEETRKQAEKDAAEKARLASRSITGSPNSGNGHAASDEGNSVLDDVRRAVRAHAA